MGAENEKFFDEIDLSKLKSLKLDFGTAEVTSKLLCRCHSLTKLFICGNPLTIESIPSLRSFLVRNQSLESLDLCHQYHNAFFRQDISDFANFQLKHLKIWNMENSSDNSDNVDRSFIKFLVKQSLSLERLDMTACTPNVVEYIFNNMPGIKYLRLLDEFKTEDLQLNVNENITELSIPSIETEEDIEKIIAVVPNVTKIHIKYLTRRNIEIIGRHLPAQLVQSIIL